MAHVFDILGRIDSGENFEFLGAAFAFRPNLQNLAGLYSRFQPLIE
jgi:hypothetical protein